MKTMLRTTLLALASNPCLAQADKLQLYGRLNLGAEALRLQGGGAGEGTRTRLSNYRSVFGVRGSEALGGDTRLVFQVEGTLSPDTGAGTVAARDTRVGLEGRWGTLFAGNWSTPYNGATAGLDPFYPTTAGYMSIMGNGAAASADNASDTSSFDRRQKNSLHYWTPAWRGLTLRLAHGFNEESPPDGAKPSLTSGALVLDQGRLYATLAHERHRAYRGPGLDDRGTKFGAAWQFGQTRLAGVAEQLHYETVDGSLERRAYYVSLTHQVGPHAWKLGVAKARDGKGGASEAVGFARSGADTGAVHATLGYDYALSKRTSVFAFYTRLDNSRRGIADFAINELDTPPGATAVGAALGLRHAF